MSNIYIQEPPTNGKVRSPPRTPGSPGGIPHRGREFWGWKGFPRSGGLSFLRPPIRTASENHLLALLSIGTLLKKSQVEMSPSTSLWSCFLVQPNSCRRGVFGVRTSVSVIIALRRAVKRHRERRERQKRVFRMSLLIISTFLLCWTPISVLNTTILCLGPSDLLVKLRLCFLVMAYGTTIFHPLLYAFTRQKFQKVLKSKMKKRVVSIVEADPMPNNAVIHNSWIDPKRNKITFEDSEIREKCLVPQVVTD